MPTCTRPICKNGCMIPQDCPEDRAPSAQAPIENREARQLVGSDASGSARIEIPQYVKHLMRESALDDPRSDLRAALIELVEAEKASRDNFDGNSIARIERAMQHADRVLFPERSSQNKHYKDQTEV